MPARRSHGPRTVVVNPAPNASAMGSMQTPNKQRWAPHVVLREYHIYNNSSLCEHRSDCSRHPKISCRAQAYACAHRISLGIPLGIPLPREANMYGKNRPTSNVPRFVQPPTFAGAGYQPFPTGPGESPYRVNLSDLVRDLPPGLERKMVFHICGDTGGVKDPNPQVRVVDAMEADYDRSPDARPAFFYHLGDVVY